MYNALFSQAGKREAWTPCVCCLTVLLIGWVGEEEDPLFLQGPGSHRRVHECVVKHQLVHRQGLPSIQTPHHYAAPTVVVVVVADVNYNTAVFHLYWL